jgi:FkbM family methyltransferase
LKKQLKKVLKTLMRSIRGYDGYTHTFSQSGEDLIVYNYFRPQLFEGYKGFYVDIGAHDPFLGSNTQLLYNMGWRGINIEPLPGAIAQFEKYRKHDTNLAMAVGPTAEPLLFHMHPQAVMSALVTEDEAKAKGIPEAQLRKIPVKTLRSILEQYVPKGKQIDLLSVDAEGLDLEVLRTNDWDIYRPKAILIEINHRLVPEVLASPEHQYLTELGYHFMAKTIINNAVSTCLYVSE